MEQTILVVGLGLIGSSLSICLKQEHPKIRLLGWDQHEPTRTIAKKTKLVDALPEDFDSGAKEADVILLAVPIQTAIAYLEHLAQLPLKADLIVTDAGSTKQAIMSCAEKLPFTFIGGHPMAGSHKSGIRAANGDLFENAYYILTPRKGQERQTAVLKELLKGTRAKYVELSAAEHDKITGMLSHLPHIIAAGLVNQSDSFSQDHPRAKQLAAGGFRDITRIASSDPKMWADILISNQRELLPLMAQWQKEMTQVQQWIRTADYQAIYDFFDHAKDTRDRLPVHENGAIPAFHDLLVDVPDKPGIIATVMGILGDAGISIINLKIQETREDIMGILQISFKTTKDLSAAKTILEKKTPYQCRIK